MEHHWKVVDNGTYSNLECDFTPNCPYCKAIDGENVALENTCIKLLHFPLNEPAYWERGEINGYAIDVECECPRCGWWTVFGVAVDKEHHKKVHKVAHEEWEEAEHERQVGKNWGHSGAQGSIPH